MKTPLLALACIGLPLLCPAVARADAIFQENFESIATGVSPAGWQNSPTAATDLKAAPDPLNVDEQVLVTPGASSRTAGAYHTFPAAVTASTGVKFSFDLYTAEAGDNNWNARWYLLDGTTASFNWFTPGYGIQLGPTNVRLHKTNGGGSSGSPGAVTTLAQATVPAAAYTTVYGWTRVELEWFADGTLQLSLNGKRVLSYVDPSPLPVSVRTISNIGFLNNNGSALPKFFGARLGYDNVTISPIHHRSAFSGLTTGVPPPDWYSSAGVAATHTVAVDPLAGANRVLATPGGVTRTTGAYHTLPSAVPAGGVRLSFDLHINNAGDDNWNTRWYLQGGATDQHERFTPGYGIYIGRDTVRLQKTSGGGNASDPGAATTLVTRSISPDLYNASGWTRVEFEWLSDGTLRLFLNGAFAASVIDPSPLTPSFRTLSTTSFVNNNASSGPVFTGALLRYDNLTITEIDAPRDDVFLLVWAATDPASDQVDDGVLRERARDATDALASKLGVKPAELGEITILLECIYQWWITGTATPTEIEGWLMAARDSMELRYAATGGATDASWETVTYVLEFLTEAIDGPGSGASHPILSSPTVVPSRFAAVPAAGVHPRVLISASELTAVRDRLANTAAGVKVRGQMTVFLNLAFVGTGTEPQPLKDAFDDLVAGDLTAMDALPFPAWRDRMTYVVCFESFLSLIDNDAVRGARAAAALTTFAQITSARALNDLAPLDEFIGYSYDFAHGFMSTAQRNTVRGVIAAATTGQQSSGTDLPAAHHRDNLVPHGMILPLLALSIEGETGYDATIYPRSVALMQNFLTHGIDAEGAPLEDMHYLNFGMAKGAPALVAMAKRGDNLFTYPNYRRLHNWLAQAMEPFGLEFSTHDDTPSGYGGLLPNYVAMKWVWPTDPVVDFVWKNRARPDYSRINQREDLLFAALFPSDWIGSDPAPVVDGPSLGLATSWNGEKRRLFIARNEWSADALTLHVECNPFLKGPGHQHANSGDFTLSALGRRWAVDHGYHVSGSAQHSIVQVDGMGQGGNTPDAAFFPAPSRLIEIGDDGDVAFSAVDSRYPYAWSYQFKSRISTLALPWRPELLMGVREYYEEAATAAYRDAPWTSPAINYPYKQPHNPLEKAFRTVLLRRATQPYVLVVDDIKKAATSSEYVWLMQIAGDLEIKQNSGGQLILGPVGSSDNRRLLVRVLEPGAGTWALESFIDEDKTFQRVKFTLNAVEPAFKVLLYPHRDGDALPATAINTSPDELTVTWSGQADVFDLNVVPGGRTTLALQP